MNKLKHRTFAPLLPERVSEMYKGNILTYSFMNEDKWEVGIFGCWRAFKKQTIKK